MKTLFLTAATAALIFAAPTAFAQDDHHDHHGHPAGQAGPAAPATNTANTPPAHNDHAAPPSNTMMMSGPTNGGGKHHHDMTTTTAAPGNGNLPGSSFHEVGKNKHGNGNFDNNNPGNNGFNGNRDNRSRGGTHVTINFNRHNTTASHHFHYRGGRYRWPGNYHYQRWSFGMTLPSIFWGRDYWIDDYQDYGLAYPPEGAVWVRYGNDALLIDQYSGEILEVVYGQFY